jgi:anti-sigma factor RsiW
VRGKISDQDLADYALNELGPEERLYVESMLAVSEECRNDVYEMIDTAMMLEEGFEREDGVTSLALTTAQRQSLLNVHVPNRIWQRSAAVLAAAAAVAFAFVSKDAWIPKMPTSQVARASSQMSSFVAQAVSSAESEDFLSQLASIRKLTEDSAKWLPAQAPAGAMVGGSAPSLSLEVAPRTSLEFVP